MKEQMEGLLEEGEKDVLVKVQRRTADRKSRFRHVHWSSWDQGWTRTGPEGSSRASKPLNKEE